MRAATDGELEQRRGLDRLPVCPRRYRADRRQRPSQRRRWHRPPTRRPPITVWFLTDALVPPVAVPTNRTPFRRQV